MHLTVVNDILINHRDYARVILTASTNQMTSVDLQVALDLIESQNRGSNIPQNRQAYSEGATIFVGGFSGPIIHDQLFQIPAGQRVPVGKGVRHSLRVTGPRRCDCQWSPCCGTINSIEIVSKFVSSKSL